MPVTRRLMPPSPWSGESSPGTGSHRASTAGRAPSRWCPRERASSDCQSAPEAWRGSAGRAQPLSQKSRTKGHCVSPRRGFSSLCKSVEPSQSPPAATLCKFSSCGHSQAPCEPVPDSSCTASAGSRLYPCLSTARGAVGHCWNLQVCDSRLSRTLSNPTRPAPGLVLRLVLRPPTPPCSSREQMWGAGRRAVECQPGTLWSALQDFQIDLTRAKQPGLGKHLQTGKESIDSRRGSTKLLWRVPKERKNFRNLFLLWAELCSPNSSAETLAPSTSERDCI